MHQRHQKSLDRIQFGRANRNVSREIVDDAPCTPVVARCLPRRMSDLAHRGNVPMSLPEGLPTNRSLSPSTPIVRIPGIQFSLFVRVSPAGGSRRRPLMWGCVTVPVSGSTRLASARSLVQLRPVDRRAFARRLIPHPMGPVPVAPRGRDSAARQAKGNDHDEHENFLRNRPDPVHWQ